MLSLQTQIFEQVRSMILEGRLRPGERLPATRALSQQLGIARNTAALAYERLSAEGYIETRPSVGTFISSQIPESALYVSNEDGTHATRTRATRRCAGKAAYRDFHSQALVNPRRGQLKVDFWVGRPDPDSFPRKAWARLIANRLRYAEPALTEYRDPSGLLDLRKAIADRLRPTRNIATNAEEILIVGGCQDGLNLISRMLLSPGSAAVVESPCYQGAAFLFESLRAEIVPVPVDESGLDTRKLPEVKNAIVYVTPSHQYPLGVTLALKRRLELLAWATRTDSYILEDDYDSDFRYHGAPLTALKGLDRTERVIYLGTFSKCLGAGLRLGYVVVPSDLVERARHMKTLMNNGQPWLEQATLADFMASGGFDRHIRNIRKLYLSRRNALLSSLERHFPGGKVIGDEAGMHLAWRLPNGFPSANEVEQIAIEAGIGVYTLASGAAKNFGKTTDNDPHLVFGFASVSENDIARGIARLSEALHPKSTAWSAWSRT